MQRCIKLSVLFSFYEKATSLYPPNAEGGFLWLEIHVSYIAADSSPRQIVASYIEAEDTIGGRR